MQNHQVSCVSTANHSTLLVCLESNPCSGATLSTLIRTHDRARCLDAALRLSVKCRSRIPDNVTQESRPAPAPPPVSVKAWLHRVQRWTKFPVLFDGQNTVYVSHHVQGKFILGICLVCKSPQAWRSWDSFMARNSRYDVPKVNRRVHVKILLPLTCMHD